MTGPERIDAIVSEGAYCPQIYDVVSYAELVAHARASLRSPDPAAVDSTAIADAFIADYGYSDLLRLYRLEREGRWNVAIRDLSVDKVVANGDSYVTVFGDGPDHRFTEGTALLYVNDRQTRGALYALTERAALADPHVIAARVHSGSKNSSFPA